MKRILPFLLALLATLEARADWSQGAEDLFGTASEIVICASLVALVLLSTAGRRRRTVALAWVVAWVDGLGSYVERHRRADSDGYAQEEMTYGDYRLHSWYRVVPMGLFRGDRKVCLDSWVAVAGEKAYLGAYGCPPQFSGRVVDGVLELPSVFIDQSGRKVVAPCRRGTRANACDDAIRELCKDATPALWSVAGRRWTVVLRSGGRKPKETLLVSDDDGDCFVPAR